MHANILLIASLCLLADGFAPVRVTLSSQQSTTRPHHSQLFAKAGKGFGKPKEQPELKPKESSVSAPSTPSASVTAEEPFLKSVAPSPSTSTTAASNAMPDNLPPEERTKLILRQQYGLKPVEEQEEDARKLEALNERRRKQQEWQQKAAAEPDFDIMTALPAPVLVAIDRFLKGGVVVCGTLFILAGLFITVEAWSKTSGQPLPADLDAFIVNTVEPNFTPGLLVLLSFSVGLGLFAAAQLGSSGASYKED
jgi:hypothetical protein